MYSEDELLPLSALQHLLFCERQCALIHIEQVWSENRLTVEGRILHERVDRSGTESRENVRVAHSVRLRSLRLGLTGKADVVEFHQVESDGIELPDVAGRWQVFPVEYKRGKPKHDACDAVQLCAQALCLEEMLNCAIPAGALFYGATRRRQDVLFDAALRQNTESTAMRLHALFAAGATPPANYEKKCKNCSLLNICMPATAGAGKSARSYLERMLKV